MGMIRFNANVDHEKVKFVTCMFDGDVMELTSLVTYLISKMYEKQLKQYGTSGGNIFKEMMEHVLSFMWEDTEKEYLNQGGQINDT